MFESPHHPREKLLYRHIPGLLRYKFYSRESCSDISSIPTMPVVATMDTNSLSTCLPGSSKPRSVASLSIATSETSKSNRIENKLPSFL